MEAFFWFYVASMPLEGYNMSDSSTYEEAGGMIYARVNHETIKTFADLENYLHSMFTDAIVYRAGWL
jgi:hypothetical protein